MSRPIPLRAAAAFGLSVLLGGLALPPLSLVLADERAPFCCSKGRCCCADEAAGRDDRTCLRRGCGCERPGEAVTGAPVRIQAVLPVTHLPAMIPPCGAGWVIADAQPLPRADAPSVPPPRRSLLA